MEDKTLYIIGNGFDLYHHLNTSYQSFAFYLQENHPDLHDAIVQYFGLPYLEKDNEKDHWNPLWSQFEKSLADLDYEEVLDDYADYAANPAADDFRDRDWHSYTFEMERIVDLLTEELCDAFKNFILSINIPIEPEIELLDINRNSLFLNFNYTSTLQRVYNVQNSQILHIHGFANDSISKVVLGHGVDPKNLIPDPPSPPPGLTEEELMHWEQKQSDNYDYSYDEARSELLTYYRKAQKTTPKIIEENEIFFDSLKNVDKIVILGHSIGEVDQPYFRKIIESVSHNAIWEVSYYSERSKAEVLSNLISSGVSPESITMKQIKMFCYQHPTLFDEITG